MRLYYEDTFEPIVRYTSIIDILAFVSLMKWKVHQIYIKKVFLNGVVEEEVYVE